VIGLKLSDKFPLRIYSEGLIDNTLYGSSAPDFRAPLIEKLRQRIPVDRNSSGYKKYSSQDKEKYKKNKT